MGGTGETGIEAVQGAQDLHRLLRPRHLGIHQRGLEGADIALAVPGRAVPGGGDHALVVVDTGILDADPVAQRAPVETKVSHMASQMRIKETGPDAILPTRIAGEPNGRRLEKS